VTRLRMHPHEVLRTRGLVAKKSFGQNFLVAPHVIDRIARACVPDEERGKSRVVELGAGLGALTAALVDRAAHVVAIERDRDLVPLLRESLADAVAEGRLTVLEDDAQSVSVRDLLPARDGSPRVLAGNLPYQLTGRLLEMAVHAARDVERVVFMVQEEVAARLVSPPSSKEYGALTVFVRAAFDVTRVAKVGPGSFYPSPGVDSSVVELSPQTPPRAQETDTFRALVKAAFGMRRKKLRNAWDRVVPDTVRLTVAAAAAGISLDARGETLDVEAFARMATVLEEGG
jgi:16S rRNA (adenine1518-N6/adenine1519-N6)-dimethyltransferase